MKRAALALVLAACSSSVNDFPPLPEGAGPGGTTGGGGTVGDAGIGDGGGNDGGVVITGRVCIVKDLRTPTVCDTTKDASGVKVTLGTRTPAAGPDHDGLFTITAPVGRPVWRATGGPFVASVMPWTTETTIPIVPELLYNDAKGGSGVGQIVEGQGSVLVRVVNGVSLVSAATNLTSNALPAAPLYTTTNSVAWTTIGPSLVSGAVWFAGVDVTSVPGKTITLTPQGGTPVITPVDVVEDQAITFVTQDLR